MVIAKKNSNKKKNPEGFFLPVFIWANTILLINFISFFFAVCAVFTFLKGIGKMDAELPN